MHFYLDLCVCFQILSVQGCLPNNQQKRDLSIHEHLSWELLAKAGVNVPKHKVTESVAEVARITEDIGRIVMLLYPMKLGQIKKYMCLG